MNVLKLIGMASVFTISCGLHAMDQCNFPLSEIEKQLVIREIAKRGYVTIPIILEIKTVFLQDEAEKDALTKTIFEKIKDIEKDLGYWPELKLVQKDGYTQGVKPTNWLGGSTRYVWVKTLTRQEFFEKKEMSNELKFQNGRPGVEVHSRFVEKEPLLEIVQNYKV